MTNKYLTNIEQFWSKYLAQYNYEYSENSLNAIAENNDETAFLHLEDLAHCRERFGENFTELPKFKKLLNFANGLMTVDKNRKKIMVENCTINPMIPQPYFGNPETADIIILNKQPENDFRTDNPNIDGQRKIRLRNRILQDFRGDLKFNGKKGFLPYEDEHIWFMKYFYGDSSILKQFNIDPNRLMIFNYFSYQTTYQAGVPKDFLYTLVVLPSQQQNADLFKMMFHDNKKRIYIVREEELWGSYFSKAFTEEEKQELLDNTFVYASKQNKYFTVGNILSYREQREKLKQKRKLSKCEYYKWNQQLKEERLNGKSDFYKRMEALKNK